MNRWFALIASMLLVLGCGGEPEPAQPAPAPENQAESGSETTALEAPEERAGTITARLFRRDAVDGEMVVPSLEVFSPKASEVKPGVMQFEDTRVTIIGQNDQRTVMTAKMGVLDQNEETAELSEQVEVQRGTQTITTDQLSWNNEKREATAIHGVTIVDGDTLLTAETMRFSPDEDTLTLENVTGTIRLPDTAPMQESRRGTWRTAALWIVMATPAYAQSAGAEYTHVVIEKPAPEVIFRGNRLEQMTGGVEIQLKTANENEPPLLLGADSIQFGWSEDGSTELASLDMAGNVRVTNAEGDMRASDAAFNVAKMNIAFTGGVSGRFEGIDEFQADRLTYDIESGDMAMQNLTATIPFGESQGGDADGFSNMDVRRAGSVRIAENRVQEMRGGVEVELVPVGGGGRPIALSADDFAFSYSNADQRQPDVVTMNGGVRVEARQGLIQSDRADFNVASSGLKFRGNVRGRSDMMSGFRASSFDYDLDTEDGLLRSFRADGIKIGGDGGYDRMDVRNAPEVQMSGGRVTKMSGGVEIHLAGDEERGPLTATAESIDIAYADAASTAPSAVDMDGDVHVTTGEVILNSDTATMDMRGEAVDFVGNFRADLPRMKGVTGSRGRYDLKTGNFKLLDGFVPEIEKSDAESNPEQP